MKMKRVMAMAHPLLELGTGLMRAFSIFRGAVRAASRLPNGLEKKAITLFEGMHASRVTWMGLVAVSLERTT